MRKGREVFLALLTLFFLTSARAGQKSVTFTDVTKKSNIGFVNASAPEKKYIVESMSGGVAFFDFDNDGKLDIYLVNSFSVEGALANRPRPPATLYRQRPDGTFEDVAVRAGVADPGWAMGVAVADYDNDGFDDLYVTCFGPNKLYRNRGDGTFDDVTAKARVGDARFSTGAAWGDYDRDGRLDLFVANYVNFKLSDLPQFGKGQLCQYRGIPVQCGPRGLAGAGDALYHNNGDGTFSEVAREARVDDPDGFYGLGVLWTDLNDDGWIDLFVANDTTPNYAYVNNRDGTFREEAVGLGLAFDDNGNEQACMGVSAGDYDGDGRLDLVVTNFSDEYNTIYRRNADGTFSDVARATQTAAPSLPFVGWGTKFFDYDNDGWPDLFVANGHVYPQIENAYAGGMYRQRKLLYRNNRDGTFAEVAANGGAALAERRVSRGAAFGDYDNDGDTDVVVNDLDGPPMLLRNDGGSQAGKWLRLQLIGTKSNRNAIGAHVSVVTRDHIRIDEVRSGDSYLSHS
ncbi:MAG TPA: VCBS repeat-containing protein, partial [Pyrinomonadaceae bacterium]|nr:VCBS repeat-containing protein [Pyrinomonadaceae bacterium]